MNADYIYHTLHLAEYSYTKFNTILALFGYSVADVISHDTTCAQITMVQDKDNVTIHIFVRLQDMRILFVSVDTIVTEDTIYLSDLFTKVRSKTYLGNYLEYMGYHYSFHIDITSTNEDDIHCTTYRDNDLIVRLYHKGDYPILIDYMLI